VPIILVPAADEAGSVTVSVNQKLAVFAVAIGAGSKAGV